MGPYFMACEILPQGRCKPVFLTCNLLQGNKISSEQWNNIMVNSSYGNIILDCWIKTCDGWVARGLQLLLLSTRKIMMSRSPFGSDYKCHCQSTRYPNHCYLQTMWRSWLRKGQKEWSEQEGCCSFKVFERKAFLWHKLSLNSYLWR